MARDDRTYITVHDGMPEHPKVEALSDRAFRVLVDLWCWCSRQLNDGVIPEAVWLKRTGSPKVRKELLAALVDVVDGEYVMHDYLEHQRSRAQVEALKAKRAEAGRKGGQARAANQASAEASASANGKHSGTKIQPPTETDTDNSGTTFLRTSDEPPREDVERVCQHLADAVEANGSKRPHVSDRWRTEARRLIDLDGRTPDQIIRAIDWCQSDAFWRANVLSMPKLREKYDQLRLAAEREQAQSRSADPRGDALRAAMERARALDEAEAAQRMEISA